MSGGVLEHFAALTRSPLLLEPILEAFFEELRPKEKNILLGYLVLPIVLHPSAKRFLSRAKSTSSLRSFLKERNRIEGLQSRIEEMRAITGIALINAIGCEVLSLREDLSISAGPRKSRAPEIFQVEIKAAAALSRLFTPYDVPTIYRLLGITRL